MLCSDARKIFVSGTTLNEGFIFDETRVVAQFLVAHLRNLEMPVPANLLDFFCEDSPRSLLRECCGFMHHTFANTRNVLSALVFQGSTRHLDPEKVFW